MLKLYLNFQTVQIKRYIFQMNLSNIHIFYAYTHENLPGFGEGLDYLHLFAEIFCLILSELLESFVCTLVLKV